ncbi:MAG: Coenzyme F420 hydrogenase/dehydrogenase, beta subunit C-terminal domain [Sulfitobacter sp.]
MPQFDAEKNPMSEARTTTPQSPALARVAKGDLCAGCGACAALAPDKVAMAVAEPGFLRPIQSAPLSMQEENGISAVCPGLSQTVEAQGRRNPVLWGPYVEVMTGHATNESIRFAGASGGGLSAVLLHLIDSGAVDAVVQTTASAKLPIGNASVITMNKKSITAAAGSRYAPSAPLEGINAQIAAYKANGTRYAFVGKPCDAAAMRAMCTRDPEVAATFPVILSFFCAGVPSHEGGREVLAKLGTTLNQTAKFRFRGNGWPGQATAIARDGTERSMSYHDSWGGILSRHVQMRCKLCADGTGTAADIVCADAWESDPDGYPLFDEAPGVSLIMARTDIGARLVAEARTEGRIKTQVFDISGLSSIQVGQRDRRRALLARLIGRRITGKPIPEYKGLQILAAARQNTIKRNLRNFLGTLRRTLWAKNL